jgi:hypothetical protein
VKDALEMNAQAVRFPLRQQTTQGLGVLQVVGIPDDLEEICAITDAHYLLVLTRFGAPPSHP